MDCLERQGYAIGVETPHEVSPTPSQSFWLIVASATSVASLLGMVSNTVLGLRKEQREARAEALDRRRQELEIEKLQLELERERASASKRIDSSPNTDDVAIQVGSNDVKRYVASNQDNRPRFSTSLLFTERMACYSLPQALSGEATMVAGIGRPCCVSLTGIPMQRLRKPSSRRSGRRAL